MPGTKFSALKHRYGQAHVREAVMRLSLRQSSAIPENLFAPRRWLRFPLRRVSKQKA